MALWEIKSDPVISHDFVAISPIEILTEFDGPLSLSFRNAKGILFFGHLAAIGKGVSRYLACETSEGIVSSLKNGRISIQTALAANQMWLIDALVDGSIQRTWKTEIKDLPAGAIPETDVLLTEDLQERAAIDEPLSRFLRSRSDSLIAFDGGPVTGHEIDAEFFGKFWERAQSLFEATARAMSLNGVGKLRLGMTSKSSYAIQVAMPDASAENTAMFESPPGHEALMQVFERVVSMLNDSVQPPQTVEMINRYQDVRNAYGHLLEVVAGRSASVKIRTKSLPAERNLSGLKANELLRAVKVLGFPYGTLEIRGRLIGGLIEKVKRQEHRFDIHAIDGEIYSGRVDTIAIDQMKTHRLGDDVLARLQIEAEDSKTQGYVLTKIEAANSALAS